MAHRGAMGVTVAQPNELLGKRLGQEWPRGLVELLGCHGTTV